MVTQKLAGREARAGLVPAIHLDRPLASGNPVPEGAREIPEDEAYRPGDDINDQICEAGSIHRQRSAA